MSKSAAEAVQVIQPGKTYIGKQGFSYGAGASTETVGARQVCMNVLPMPPGAKAKVHYHKGIETIAYLWKANAQSFTGMNWNSEQWRMLVTKFIFRRTSHMLRTIRAPRRVSGS
jgi:uncharacterized RmlC-like cupin family protein